MLWIIVTFLIRGCKLPVWTESNSTSSRNPPFLPCWLANCQIEFGSTFMTFYFPFLCCLLLFIMLFASDDEGKMGTFFRNWPFRFDIWVKRARFTLYVSIWVIFWQILFDKRIFFRCSVKLKIGLSGLLVKWIVTNICYFLSGGRDQCFWGLFLA